MAPTPAQITKNHMFIRIRMIIAMIVFILNCYFFTGLYIGHIKTTYMSLLLYFNISSFVLIIMNLCLRFNFSLFIIRTIGISILISTLIFLVYYIFISIQ